MDSIWLWPLALVAFLLAWPALRALGVRLLSGKLRSQALAPQPDHIFLVRVADPKWRDPQTPASAERSLAAAGFVEAGVYLSDRTYVGLQLNLGADRTKGENSAAAKLEYQLTKSWSFETTAGDAPAVGAELVWSHDY